MELRGDAATAVASERIIFPGVRVLAGQHTGAAKALLTRATSAIPATDPPVALRRIARRAQWRRYEERRISVEAGFGVGQEQARAMVATLRGEQERIGLDVFFAEHLGEEVGAIARFSMPPPNHHWARLQEVDIFPAWRGNGLGTSMLLAMIGLLFEEGSTMVAVGADEEDWPLKWYQRHGFRIVARVQP